jgi:hypothetical protein
MTNKATLNLLARCRRDALARAQDAEERGEAEMAAWLRRLADEFAAEAEASIREPEASAVEAPRVVAWSRPSRWPFRARPVRRFVTRGRLPAVSY